MATPAIESGPFMRSVVFVLDHDADGALGVILNRPLDSEVDDVLPDWAGLVNAPVCLFDGGPVAMDSALALGVIADVAPPIGWRQMAGRVGLVDLEGPLPGNGEFAGIRVFAGYAGWGADQLEAELEEGAWLVVEALRLRPHVTAARDALARGAATPGQRRRGSGRHSPKTRPPTDASVTRTR